MTTQQTLLVDSTTKLLKEIREDLERNAKTSLIEREIYGNNPDAHFIVTEELNLKEYEAIICLGMAGGINIGPKNPSWKTIKFSTKTSMLPRLKTSIRNTRINNDRVSKTSYMGQGKNGMGLLMFAFFTQRTPMFFYKIKNMIYVM